MERLKPLYCPGCKKYYSLKEQRVDLVAQLVQYRHVSWMCWTIGCHEDLIIPYRQCNLDFWEGVEVR